MEINEIIKEQYGMDIFPEKVSEAMAYVPFQPDNSAVCSPTQGFASGTMFPRLNKPFYAGKCGGRFD